MLKGSVLVLQDRNSISSVEVTDTEEEENVSCDTLHFPRGTRGGKRPKLGDSALSFDLDCKCSRDGRFGSKMGQIGPKWDKSGTFSDQT